MKVYSRPTTFSFRELSKQQTKRDIVHIYIYNLLIRSELGIFYLGTNVKIEKTKYKAKRVGRDLLTKLK